MNAVFRSVFSLKEFLKVELRGECAVSKLNSVGYFKDGVKPERYESPSSRPKPSPFFPRKKKIHIVLLTVEVLEQMNGE